MKRLLGVLLVLTLFSGVGIAAVEVEAMYDCHGVKETVIKLQSNEAYEVDVSRDMLFAAIDSNDYKEVQRILICGGSAKAVKEGVTALAEAAKYGNIRIITELLNYGARVTEDAIEMAADDDIREMLEDVRNMQEERG